jgi:hypothetical protein
MPPPADAEALIVICVLLTALPPSVVLPLAANVVKAPVLGVVAPTVPLMLIELTPVKVLFNPRIEAPEVP